MTANFKLARPLAIALGLAAIAAMPAHAADAITEVPPAPGAPMDVPPVASWGGAYAGATIGYGFSGQTSEPGNDIDTDGFIGSGFVGYNYDMGTGLVVGAEADLGYSDVSGVNAGTQSDGGVGGSLRARLGYAVTPDILLYGTAGGAAQSMKITDALGSDRNTMLGWTAGAGADIKMTESVFGRVEYRYTDFGSETFNTGATRDVDASDHRIQFGVGMKF